MNDIVTVPGNKLKAMQDKIARLESENNILEYENKAYKGEPHIVAGMVSCPHCGRVYFMEAKHLKAGGE